MKQATVLRNDIKKAKKKLTNKAIKKGLWENFGQDEVRKIEDKHDKLTLTYGDKEQRVMSDEIDAFCVWCRNFNDADLRRAKQEA
ncbi:MAG: hypothetical protein WD512_13795 [Candidatus Paceibacterota bacterium]